MRTVSAQEIKRRGISAVDDALEAGPVRVIKGNVPRYVVMTEERYGELLQAEEDAYLARIKASLAEVEAGRVTRGTAQDLIDELGLEDP